MKEWSRRDIVRMRKEVVKAEAAAVAVGAESVA